MRENIKKVVIPIEDIENVDITIRNEFILRTRKGEFLFSQETKSAEAFSVLISLLLSEPTNAVLNDPYKYLGRFKKLLKEKYKDARFIISYEKGVLNKVFTFFVEGIVAGSVIHLISLLRYYFNLRVESVSTNSRTGDVLVTFVLGIPSIFFGRPINYITNAKMTVEFTKKMLKIYIYFPILVNGKPYAIPSEIIYADDLLDFPTEIMPDIFKDVIEVDSWLTSIFS